MHWLDWLHFFWLCKFELFIFFCVDDWTLHTKPLGQLWATSWQEIFFNSCWVLHGWLGNVFQLLTYLQLADRECFSTPAKPSTGSQRTTFTHVLLATSGRWSSKSWSNIQEHTKTSSKVKLNYIGIILPKTPSNIISCLGLGGPYTVWPSGWPRTGRSTIQQMTDRWGTLINW